MRILPELETITFFWWLNLLLKIIVPDPPTEGFPDGEKAIFL